MRPLMKGRTQSEKHELWSCIRKRCFLTYLDALKAAALLAKDKNTPNLETYPCEYCGLFHIGTLHWKSKREKYLKELRKRINNPGFLKKAPPMIIELAKARLLVLEKELEWLHEHHD